jgi:hypothetical protein
MHVCTTVTEPFRPSTQQIELAQDLLQNFAPSLAWNQRPRTRTYRQVIALRPAMIPQRNEARKVPCEVCAAASRQNGKLQPWQTVGAGLPAAATE